MLRIFTAKKSNARRLLSNADTARDQLHWTEAANAYRLFLIEEPERGHIWVQYGHALKESGALDEAERAYEKAIELMPRDADARLQIGHLYKMRSRHQDALLSYELAYFLNPTLRQARDELLRLRTHVETMSMRRLQDYFSSVLVSVPVTDADKLAAASLTPLENLYTGFDQRLNAVVSQVDHILSHVAITKALGAELARLSRRLEQQRSGSIESLRQ